MRGSNDAVRIGWLSLFYGNAQKVPNKPLCRNKAKWISELKLSLRSDCSMRSNIVAGL